MALYSIGGEGRTREITHMPHADEFGFWCSRLSSDQLEAIRQELRRMIDGDEIHTAGWMPGNRWSGTVWDPIFTVACRGDREASGLCFGLFVWEAVQNHPEAWSFGRYEKDGVEIRSLTYFRINDPDSV